ncbi:hypothetical protein [Metallibacterium scheffleri]
MTLPPDLLPLSAFDGNWQNYETELYRIFLEEIAHGGLRFRGLPVRCRRHTEVSGRWASFWHLVQEGPVEDKRLPDLRRCERIRWVPWMIMNGDAHPAIQEWMNARGAEVNWLLWYQEEYLVVLGRRMDCWLLKTAYCTEKSGRIRQLRRERDAWIAAGGGSGP